MATKASNWRQGFGSGEFLQRIRPIYEPGVLLNPHKGTTTSQRFNGDGVRIYQSGMYAKPAFPEPAGKDFPTDLYPDTRIAYFRWPWSVLEPEKGQFRWDIIDNVLAIAAQRNQMVQLRSMPYVGSADMPPWYWKTGARHDKAEFRNTALRVPDHNDKRYIRHWNEHTLAMGERYDGHPNLDSVDIGYGGSCGEVNGNATYATAAALVDAYLKAWPTTQLTSMLGTNGCRYAATIKDRRIGWRADCYGDMRAGGKGHVPDHLCWDHMHDAYPREIIEDGVADTWKIAPVIWEPCWSPPHWYEQGWDIDWIIEQGYKYHPSVFMAKSHYWPKPWYNRLLHFSETIGYRFHLHQMILPLQAKPGQRVTMEAVIDNKGCAPIYKPYRFALRFTQAAQTKTPAHHVVLLKQDIRNWMPDLNWFRETIAIPRGLKKGTADVSCSIVNAANQPVVKLAIQPLAKDGWQVLSHIDVL